MAPAPRCRSPKKSITRSILRGRSTVNTSIRSPLRGRRHSRESRFIAPPFMRPRRQVLSAAAARASAVPQQGRSGSRRLTDDGGRQLAIPRAAECDSAQCPPKPHRPDGASHMGDACAPGLQAGTVVGGTRRQLERTRCEEGGHAVVARLPIDGSPVSAARRSREASRSFFHAAACTLAVRVGRRRDRTESRRSRAGRA